VGLDENIWISRYQLKSEETINARSGRRVFEGALIRKGPGFSSLHPWPELGDPDLEECLEDLKHGGEHPLVRKALIWLKADAAAREAGRSLFEGQVPARSHATLPVLSRERVAEAARKGFTHVKSKAGRQLPDELETIRALGKEFPDLKWRIDFNGCGTYEALNAIFSKWSREELKRVDFLEDPIPENFEEWVILSEETGMMMAEDRFHDPVGSSARVSILKPAVDLIEDGPGRRVVTSYMDHPVGQCFAAWESLIVSQDEVFGLQTHDLFEKNVFSELLGESGPEFMIPEGIGIGFDDCLEDQEWCVL